MRLMENSESGEGGQSVRTFLDSAGVFSLNQRPPPNASGKKRAAGAAARHENEDYVARVSLVKRLQSYLIDYYACVGLV